MEDGHATARKFEKYLMERRIKALTDIEDVKKVAIGLAELNWGYKETVALWARNGWAPEQ